MLIELRKSLKEELPAFVAMESSIENSEFIIPYGLEKHLSEMNNKDVLYLSIYSDDELQGFFILGVGNKHEIEFRRIIVSSKGQGIGQASIALMEVYCQEHFGCKRIWLDVFSFNEKGQHIYKKLGYKQFGDDVYDDKQLLLFEKSI